MTGIELGHALITMIEPDRETILEYHRWYEKDHFLAGVLVGPGAFAGQRWVATRELKALRRPVDSPVAQPVEDGSFITLYWIERDKLSDHTDWGFPEAARFAAEGRMDPRRHHVSTSYYDLVEVVARDAASAPAELAIHRQYPGLVVVWADPRTVDPATLVGGPFDQVVTFRNIRLPEPLPAMPGTVMSDPDRTVEVHLCFVDDTSGDWAERLDPEGALLVAPFIPTVPGTTTHLDQLW
jgi:hypothetical protein